MEYTIAEGTLIINGSFEALSSGIDGGRSAVKSIINSQVPEDFDHTDPKGYLEATSDHLKIKRPYFGLMTAVDMKNLCIIKDGGLTTFVTAGIKNPSSFGTINIILVAEGVLSEGGMVGSAITATEAKTLALRDLGLNFTGTNTDAIVVAFENKTPEYHEYAGPFTDFGKKIGKSVRRGVRESIMKEENIHEED